MGRISEIRVYEYICRALHDAGFNTAPRGMLYTQGEFRGRNPLLTNALGHKTPDYIAVIRPQDKYWIIEAKRP